MRPKKFCPSFCDLGTDDGLGMMVSVDGTPESFMLRTMVMTSALSIALAGLASPFPAIAQSFGNPNDHLLAGCSTNDPVRRAFCERSRTNFPGEWNRALQGDYGAQRNVAFCLQDGCDGALLPNPLLSCAWRMVITTSGHSEYGYGDDANLRLACGRLSESLRVAAAAQARRILEVIRVAR